MSSTNKPASTVPAPDADAQAPAQNPGVATVSRRDFLAATAATGIALGSGPSVSALAPETAGSAPAGGAAAQGVVSNPLPSGDAFEMYDGTAAGAVLAQLRAAGVRM